MSSLALGFEARTGLVSYFAIEEGHGCLLPTVFASQEARSLRT